MLEIGGYPFYFSMCLQRLGVDLTTVDLAPQRAQDLIRKYSLRVITCDIEREPLPFENHTIATIALCATFEHFEGGSTLCPRRNAKSTAAGWLTLSYDSKSVSTWQCCELCTRTRTRV